MFTLFVLALVVMGVVAGMLLNTVKQHRAEVVWLQKKVAQLEARLNSITDKNDVDGVGKN